MSMTRGLEPMPSDAALLRRKAELEALLPRGARGRVSWVGDSVADMRLGPDSPLAAKPKRARPGSEEHDAKTGLDPHAMLARSMAANGLPAPVREHLFALPRKWRFDYAWPQHRVALEVEGGVWTNGRHTRGSGFLRDVEKYNRAAVLGWRVVRCTPATLCAPDTITMLRQMLGPVPGGA